MHRSVQLDDGEYAAAIDREIGHIRDSGELGRSSKLRALFDYLVERSRSGSPPREVEIAQDVFGRTAQGSDDGAGRVYIHRLRRRLEDIYKQRRDAELRIALPLGEYRLIGEIGEAEAPELLPARTAPQPRPWRLFALGAGAGLIASLLIGLLLFPFPDAGSREAAQARRSEMWAPLLGNGKSVIVAEGDNYLFAEKGPDGRIVRLIRDYRIHSREDLDAYLFANPHEATRYGDAGQSYVPTTVPRAQLYLSRILLSAPNVRMLPASQVPAAAILSQNIIYLGLASGLGPLNSPVASGSRFEIGRDADLIRDRKTGEAYGGQPAADAGSPRRQYGLLSRFIGKEGNRYIVLAGTSEMGLVGLAETLADPKRLDEFAKATRGSSTAEALYQIDSQGPGILAVRLIATNLRDEKRLWQP